MQHDCRGVVGRLGKRQINLVLRFVTQCSQLYVLHNSHDRVPGRAALCETNLMTQRIFLLEKTADQRVVDDDCRWSVGPVLLSNKAALHQMKAHRVEIAGSYGVDHSAWDFIRPWLGTVNHKESGRRGTVSRKHKTGRRTG